MSNLKRNIQMKFRVTPEERKLIEQKMALLPTKQSKNTVNKLDNTSMCMI